MSPNLTSQKYGLTVLISAFDSTTLNSSKPFRGFSIIVGVTGNISDQGIPLICNLSCKRTMKKLAREMNWTRLPVSINLCTMFNFIHVFRCIKVFPKLLKVIKAPENAWPTRQVLRKLILAIILTAWQASYGYWSRKTIKLMSQRISFSPSSISLCTVLLLELALLLFSFALSHSVFRCSSEMCRLFSWHRSFSFSRCSSL